MAKILGLDLGTNSVGWAVVDAKIDETGKVASYNFIDGTGVRIFPEGVVKDTIGKGDKEQSKNATRREKRQMRRQYYRKRLRKIKLLETLIKQGMCPLDISELKKWKNWDRNRKTEGKKFPDSKEFVEWLKMNPYELRSKAIAEPLSFHELGRIYYHFIQRRGFLSSRKGNDESSIFTKGKPDENILPINKTKEEIGNSTLGIYLNQVRYKDNEPYHKKTDADGIEIRPRGRYTTRDMYIEEFEKIWNFQSQFLDINGRIVESKKVRELKGSLDGKRNRKKIEALKKKYGPENIFIGKRDKKGITKVTSSQKLPLKEFLAGEITYIQDEEGKPKVQFKSNDSVLFWQRPLRSQKSLLSNCRFENELPVINKDDTFRLNKEGKIQTRSKKPCPLSHPEFELFRAYQFINNIKYGKNQSLTDEQKSTVLDIINKKDKNFDFGTIPKTLKLTYEKFNFDDNLKVPGNPTIKQIKPLFPVSVWEQHAEEIWHCFYFYDDNEKLLEKLQRDFGFTKDLEAVKKVRLKEGYSNVSLKAIRNIMPFLEKGMMFDRAVLMGGIRNAFGKDRWEYFKDWHHLIDHEVKGILSEDNKEGEVIEKIKKFLSLPVNSFGFAEDDVHFTHLYHHSQEIEKKEKLDDYLPEVENLRNPIVQQGLHETRRLVNSLIRKYKNEYGEDFHFHQIKVEMGRDLRNTKSKRQEISIRISENEKKNDEARERLAEYGLAPSRTNIQKYLMYKEIEEKAGKAQCPYTGKIISIADLLGTDNAIQIEHIIPYSVSLDDGFGNKTLCEANFNNVKGEKTPHEFYEVNPDPKLWNASSWDEVAVRAFQILPYAKAKRFTSKKKFEKSAFIERQLNDSRYIAKKSAELLSHVCKDVRVMPGQLTAELRHLWGLNNILQPMKDLDSHAFDVDDETGIPYYVVTDEKNDVVSLHRKMNDKPQTQSNEILLSGYGKKDRITSKFFRFDVETPGLKDGKYWLKFAVKNDIKLLQKFIEKPESDENSIVFRGRSEKGYFNNDTVGKIKSGVEDGTYWAKFQIQNKKYEAPQKDVQPKTKRNQILLFGNVVNREFKCYIYRCDTDLADGKYWIILDVNLDNVEFIRAVNPQPEITDNQLLITTTINEYGQMVADPDGDYKINTNEQAGKYYATLTVESIQPEIFPIENDPPQIDKTQKIIEGNIWVDKYSGEIKFDPKKNREDQRHHAIDAITIACTEQGFLQRLSTYNAQRKEKQRGKLDSTENFPEPWLGFDQSVKKAANNILVSYHKDNKALVKNKKGFSVKGQLHDETYYGKKDYCKEKEVTSRVPISKLKFKRTKGQAIYVDDIVDNGIKDAIYRQISILLSTEEKKEILKEIVYRSSTVQSLSKKIEQEKEEKAIEKLKEKINADVEDILKDTQFYLENEGKRAVRKGVYDASTKRSPVPIKKVKVKKAIGNARVLKEIKYYSPKKEDVVSGFQYINPGNNHHVLIYEKNDRKVEQDPVPFRDVIERKKQGQELYQLPYDGKKIIEILEINDMFLLGLSDDEFEANKNNYAFLSRYLYRVQKLSSMYYTFRYHLASTVTNKEEEIYFQSLGAYLKANPIKIEIDQLGNIKRL